MIFNKHLDLEGKHAFLSPSKWHWQNYDKEKLITSFRNDKAVYRGTLLHQFAHDAITLGEPLERNNRTLNSFVNDAIGYRMSSEVTLYYSKHCFGTADAISFDDNVLRIHDLKTGVTPAHMEQLLTYAALFFLEYKIKPKNVQTILCIYQNDDIFTAEPTPEEIEDLMHLIVKYSKLLDKEEDGYYV